MNRLYRQDHLDRFVIGNFLRRSTIDEIPTLFNVLKAYVNLS